MKWLTLKKGIYCLVRPGLWRHIAKGVAPAIEHSHALSRFTFNTVVDVGANRGQFALMARRLFPHARIHSFEPLPEPAAVFESLFDEDRNTVLVNRAIGSESRVAEMFVTTRDDSSSLLSPGQMQANVFDVTAVGRETINVSRLNDWISLKDVCQPALLKIDVQGGELEVLNGSSDLIDSFQAVYVESSYIHMYDGQCLIGEIVCWMAEHGFRLHGAFNQHNDPRYGAVQADFLFLKSV